MARKTIFAISIVTFSVLCLLIPYILTPTQLFNHNNDLSQVFLPTYRFIHLKTFEFGSFPKWNNTIFSGTPIAPDPQFSLFYPINFLFLILDVNAAIQIFYFLHLTFAGIIFYFFLKRNLRFDQIPSIFGSIIYVINPKVASTLEAGHYGIIAAYSWIPLVLLLITRKKPTVRSALFLAVALTAIFLNHSIIFSVVFGVALLIAIYKKTLLLFMLSVLAFGGLSAGALLPQIEWFGLSTRAILLDKPELYPYWISRTEILKSFIAPWIGGINNLWALDTEKIITIPIGVLVLSSMGFVKLKKKFKLCFVLIFAISLLISSNNFSPFYNLMLNFRPMQLARVTTRIWIVPLISLIIISSYGIKVISKRLHFRIIYILIFLTFLESFLFSWTILNKPSKRVTARAPEEILATLVNDKDLFRVFCLTRCIDQSFAVNNNLQLIEGYNTFQQKNYYEHSWQLMGGYWDYYTLSLPPIGAYLNEKLQPNIKSLGEYNAKYLISPYILNNENLTLIKETESYFLYENLLSEPRAYFSPKTSNYPKIEFYSPNFIRVVIPENHPSSLILAEVYNPNWHAYLNGEQKIITQETPNRLRLVDLEEDTQYVDFMYESKYAKIGLIITLATICIFIYVYLTNE